MRTMHHAQIAKRAFALKKFFVVVYRVGMPRVMQILGIKEGA